MRWPREKMGGEKRADSQKVQRKPKNATRGRRELRHGKSGRVWRIRAKD